jgi:hypothetical protein
MTRVHHCNIWLLCCPAWVSDNDDDDACRKFKSDNDGNVVAAAATLPDFWWRALDVSTKDIANVIDTLLGVCAWKGLKHARGMRCF